MKKISALTSKLIFIGVIIGLLLIANLFIGGKLDDREYTKNRAVEDIYNSAGGSFIISDLFITIPYSYTVTKLNSKGVKYDELEYSSKIIRANKLSYSTKLTTEKRKIGIYSAPVFNGDLTINGDFDTTPSLSESEYNFMYNKAKLSILIKNRSLIEAPVFILNGKEYESQFDYSRAQNTFSSIYSDFKCEKGKIKLNTTLKIRGAESFNIFLASENTKLKIESNWNSPSFKDYAYLPSYDITDQGFSADWDIPFDTGKGENKIGFKLVQSVDIYKMVERAIKYGFLFIIVPFIVLFLFEIFMEIQLHPVNYLLCGAASIVFFLLLLSFSEHINFELSYLISAAASGIVISLYVTSLTAKFKFGAEMCGVFILMYGYLFFSLKSEDYALLIGSVFIFIIIALFMYFTRKIDWNNLKIKNLKSTDKNQ